MLGAITECSGEDPHRRMISVVTERIFALFFLSISLGLAASSSSHRAILLTPFWYWVQSTATGNYGWKVGGNPRTPTRLSAKPSAHPFPNVEASSCSDTTTDHIPISGSPAPSLPVCSF